MKSEIYISKGTGGTFLNINNESGNLAIKIDNEVADVIESLQQQLEKERLEINSNDPYNYVLTNPKGDTFTFNPQKGIGEELNDFLYGYFNL